MPSSQSIYYKFKSARDYFTISLDGPFMLCSKLKQQIMLERNLAKSTDHDIKVEDVQTGREYHDNSKIYANTSVLVSRVPITRGAKTLQAKKSTSSGIPGLSSDASSGPSIPGLGAPEPKKNGAFGDDIFSGAGANGRANKNQSEEDRMKQLLNATNAEYAPDKPVGFHHRGQTGKTPPAGYVCYRCGKPNHYIQDCPTNGDPNFNIKRVKRAPGIPSIFLQKVDPTQVGEKGAMMLPDGQIAVMKPNESGFTKEVESSNKIVEVPDTLKCPICKGLFKNAVLAACCGKSFCESCITTHLLEKSASTCPNCKKKLAVNSLVANATLNENVQAFRTSNPNVASKDAERREENKKRLDSAGKRRSPPASRGRYRQRTPPSHRGRDRHHLYDHRESTRRRELSEKERNEQAIRARHREDRIRDDRRRHERVDRERDYSRPRRERLPSRDRDVPPPHHSRYERRPSPYAADRYARDRPAPAPPRRRSPPPASYRRSRERSPYDSARPHGRRERYDRHVPPPRREPSPRDRHARPPHRGESPMSRKHINLSELERDEYRHSRPAHNDRYRVERDSGRYRR